MFDGMKGLGDLGEMMRKAQQMQDQLKTMQEEMGKKQVTAEAGGGMVQAMVNGRMELVRLKIDPAKVDMNDMELLEDVIIAAVQAAQLRAAEMMKSQMQKAAGDLGLPPGMLG